jgi:hypothetical protein
VHLLLIIQCIVTSGTFVSHLLNAHILNIDTDLYQRQELACKALPPKNMKSTGAAKFLDKNLVLTEFLSLNHPPGWIGQQESDIYMWSMVPVTGLRGRYFLPMTTGVSKVASYMITSALARTNHKMATDFECSSLAQFCYRLTVWIFLGQPFCCVVVSFIFVVEYMCVCNVHYSIFLLQIVFYIYAFPSMFHGTEKDYNMALMCVW